MQRAPNSPIPLDRQLERLLLRQQPIPANLAPREVLLDALVQCLQRDSQGHRRLHASGARALAMGMVVCAAVMLTGHPLQAFWSAPFFQYAFFTLFSRSKVPTVAGECLRTIVLPGATPSMAPDLLRLRSLLRDKPARADLDAALQSLLPRFTEIAHLDDDHRAILRAVAVDAHERRPELAAAALLLLADSGDAGLESTAARWRDGYPEQRLGEASREYLAALGRRG